MSDDTVHFECIFGFIISWFTADQSKPSFDMKFLVPIRVKNTNFRPYKYDATAVDFTYGGVVVGQVIIPKSKANFKSTKKIDVEVSLNSNALSTAASSGLANKLGSGVITLGSQGR
ncbi:hypothetical protein MLD38_029648 [Melastoma candidum]|uniref:Uncharacterized protein n=1 Tax=Melastoma candidum TaxID=119954 RepID=A0ACB9NA13_9MYRT|nr:hypothetical protein MLD38_029648 [Melastoma candidum]